VAGVSGPETLGDQHLHGLPEQRVAVVAEEPFGLPVHQQHLAACVDDDHRVGSGLQQLAEVPLDGADQEAGVRS
jgi:hypothetical protein